MVYLPLPELDERIAVVTNQTGLNRSTHTWWIRSLALKA
jgi:hypothetical protein